jgi:SAM-dependent methyltransferase
MAASPEVFSASAAVYDLLYAEKDTPAEVAWITRTLEAQGCTPGGHLLEFGSGTGRHARLFADGGYQVTGVEPSSDMIERADTHPQVTYLQGNTSTTRLDNSVDAVLSLFHVMSYHTTMDELHAFFDTARHHLNPGGLFGFDVWYSPAVHHLTPESRVLETSNDHISVVRTATPSEDIPNSLVTVTYDYVVTERATGKESRFTEVHPMRHFSQTEIAMLAKLHGFSVEESMEFMTGSTPGRDTWGVWFTLRKV